MHDLIRQDFGDDAQTANPHTLCPTFPTGWIKASLLPPAMRSDGMGEIENGKTDPIRTEVERLDYRLRTKAWATGCRDARINTFGTLLREQGILDTGDPSTVPSD